MTSPLSIILPSRNEAARLRTLLPAIRAAQPEAEILLVDDGSDDDTVGVARAQEVRVIRHPYPMGNGAAIKTGARHAGGEILIFMDADGQHDPRDLQRLLDRLHEGYHMVVGARGPESHAGLGRRWANAIYNRIASWMVGRRIADLTSGLRVVRAKHFRRFLYLLPNGFSYPTTITMAFFRSGFTVAYEPIHAGRRTGKSHIQPMRDSLRFLLIIFRVGTLYSPLKIFFPVSLALFVTGLGYYAHTYFTMGRFTNMSALLFIVAVILFMIGLVSEQITNLLYSRTADDD